LTHLEFIVGIPARHASTRLPGKPLRTLAGKPLIAHVVERARESGASEVFVATDDERIVEAAEEAGAAVCLTDPECGSGTDRLAQCAERRHWPDESIVVNLQGDEPLLPGRWLQLAATALDGMPGADVATLAAPETDVEAVFDPHVVKVVTDSRGFALYFSRAPIPWHRGAFAGRPGALPRDGAWLRHIGVYAYRVGYLKRLAAMEPAGLERIESLEQLRVLASGGRIHVSVVDEAPPPGVDTEADLQRLEALIGGYGT